MEIQILHLFYFQLFQQVQDYILLIKELKMSSLTIFSASLAVIAVGFALYVHFTTKNKHNTSHHKE